MCLVIVLSMKCPSRKSTVDEILYKLYFLWNILYVKFQKRCRIRVRYFILILVKASSLSWYRTLEVRHFLLVKFLCSAVLKTFLFSFFTYTFPVGKYYINNTIVLIICNLVRIWPTPRQKILGISYYLLMFLLIFS